MSRSEQRLRKIEQSLGVDEKLERRLTFYVPVRFRDEPDDLICGARMGEFVWKRAQGEAVKAFEERIAQDVRGRPRTDHRTAEIILLEKDYSGLPEPNEGMPAYTPYLEVLRRLKEAQGLHHGLQSFSEAGNGKTC